MKLRNIIGVAAGGALLGAALFAGGAGAAPADTTGTADATMHILLPLASLDTTLDLTVALPDGEFNGTVDDETGAITGAVSYSSDEFDATTPDGPTTINGEASVDDISGTVDAGGDFTGTGEITFVIHTLDLGGGNIADLGTCPIKSNPLDLTGQFDSTTGALTLAAADFGFQQVGPDDCNTLAELINSEIVNGVGDMSATIQLPAAPPVTEPPTTETPTTDVPTTEAPTTAAPTTVAPGGNGSNGQASAATPVSGSPSYTG